MNKISRCPECGGKMKYIPNTKAMVCQSCGLSLSRFELENYWKKIRSENFSEADESQQRKNRRKEWLEWYSKSKSEKEGF